ncbi:MAG TPA: acyl-CoA dehydrogenase family protein, partial [Acidimicrobiia bacterium]|nr:acyl-CoA dehydrogenase family protein [Acidimicrobiia bacterium]
FADVADGRAVATFSPRPAVAGTAELVPGGAAADVVVGIDGDELVAVRADAPGVSPPNLGATALADRDLGDPAGSRTTLAAGADARRAFDTALDEWRVLTAAALVGLSQRALDIGVDYVKARQQYGVPIGSFQGIQHKLADVATALAGARLLARHAAGGDRFELLAPMTFWFAGRTAEAVAAASLHFHGGYGFMLEYDIQLFLRRAKAWMLALGDPAAELAVVATRLAARRWGLDDEAEPTGLAAELRAFLAEHCPPELVDHAWETGTLHDWGLHRALAERRWLAVSWPREQGGLGLDPFETAAFNEELARAGAPMDGWGGAELVAHTIDICGTDQQQREILPRLLGGEAIACLGYSEPDSGSDIASVSTRAVRDGDHWIVNGQKMFTTLAHESEYVLLLTRTNPDVPKHRGLTLFIVPMDTPGIEITPIETLGGERTNVTFYSDVRVPDSCRIGEVDGGWRVLTVALAFERSPVAQGQTRRLYRQVVEWASTAERDGRPLLDDPAVRSRLATIAVDLEVGERLAQEMTTIVARGGLPIVEGSIAKLFVTEALARAASNVLDMAGAAGVLQHGAAGAPAGGWIEHTYRHAQVMTIHSGSSEIQRNIIAERGLGLPKGR